MTAATAASALMDLPHRLNVLTQTQATLQRLLRRAHSEIAELLELDEANRSELEAAKAEALNANASATESRLQCETLRQQMKDLQQQHSECLVCGP